MLYVRVDDAELKRMLRHMPDQIPFALSLSLNRTAWDARQRLAAEVGEHFVVRNKWTERGMRMERSTKNHLFAAVGSTREYMIAQTFGEQRTSTGRAVPLVGPGRPRPRITSRTTPSKWPKALLNKANMFIGWSGHGHGVYGLWKRTARAARSKRSKRGVKLLYRFPDVVRIEARWPLEDTVNRVVKEKWPGHVVAAVEKAIATARRKR